MRHGMHRLTTVTVDFAIGTAIAAADFADVAGFAWPEAADLQTLALHILDHVSSNDRARLREHIRDVLSGSSPDAGLIEFEVVAGGSRRSLQCSWWLEGRSEGLPGRLLVTCFHDSSAATADAQRNEIEQRYRLALKAGRMGSWETDYVARTRMWSEEALGLFGLQLADGRGQVGGPSDEWRLALHPADRRLADRYRDVADHQDSFEAEYRVVRPDGTVAWLSGRGLVVARQADGRAWRLVSIMADVTERREAQERLRIERERLDLALGAGDMGAFDLDIQMDVLWWSPGMYAVFGVTPETFTPTREGVLTLLHPEDRAAFVQARNAAIAERRPFTLEVRVARPDGRVAWLAHIGRVEHGDDGRPLRTYGITMDVTRRRLQEEALREADRQKDRFIATLAHELRNPLAPIRNSVELLRRLHGANDQLARHGEVIDRQVTHMSRLLDDLLDVSRITAGTIRLHREPVAVSAMLDAAIEVAMPIVSSMSHRLEFELPEEPLHVDGDPVRLAQVFSNLILNAARYSPARSRITLKVQKTGAQVDVGVIDEGFGIAPQDIPRLFQVFGQLDSGPDRAKSGLGIGLWLARALVELHGGAIEARSEGAGRGSAFHVRLPLAALSHASRGTRESRSAAPAQAPLVVLVADDKADVADSLASLLRLEGHDVHVAYTGDDALAVAQRVRPDVAFLDLGMPGRTGFEVCRALRAEPWAGRLKLIAQTGWGLAEHRARSREAGFDHHVVKPVEPEHLVALLREAGRT